MCQTANIIRSTLKEFPQANLGSQACRKTITEKILKRLKENLLSTGDGTVNDLDQFKIQASA